MESETLRSCTAEIVAAYVRRNSIPTTEIPTLMNTVHTALSGLVQNDDQPGLPDQQEPAVPIRRSVRPDAIVCLECGFMGKMIRRHLLSEHGLKPDQYRKRWNLPTDYPMTAPEYSQERSRLAKETGLGRGRRPLDVKAVEPPPPPEPPPEPAPARRRARKAKQA